MTSNFTITLVVVAVLLAMIAVGAVGTVYSDFILAPLEGLGISLWWPGGG